MNPGAPRVGSFFNPFVGKGDAPPKPSADVRALHEALPCYAPTPLYSLPGLADELGVGEILLKDESGRFGLSTFKALGASYAVFRAVDKLWREKTKKPLDAASLLKADLSPLGPLSFAAAADPNHARAVAWMAGLLGQKAVAYVPAAASASRLKAVRAAGAQLKIVDGNYDETVRQAGVEASKKGWILVSEPGYPGNMDVPGWIQDGYTTLFREADAQISDQKLPVPDFVFLQGSVGSLACAAAMHYGVPGRRRRPSLAVVEPVDASCLLDSISSAGGQPRTTKGSQDSIMESLNYPTPSLAAWPVLRSCLDYFLAVDDIFAEEAMGRLFKPASDDPRIAASPSGAAGLAGLFALCRKPELEEDKEKLGIGEGTTILLLNTEGDTDPDFFEEIVGERSSPKPSRRK